MAVVDQGVVAQGLVELALLLAVALVVVMVVMVVLDCTAVVVALAGILEMAVLAVIKGQLVVGQMDLLDQVVVAVVVLVAVVLALAAPAIILFTFLAVAVAVLATMVKAQAVLVGANLQPTQVAEGVHAAVLVALLLLHTIHSKEVVMVALSVAVVVALVVNVIRHIWEQAVLGLFALFGQETHVHSHQLALVHRNS
jgi:hypothetical protein